MTQECGRYLANIAMDIGAIKISPLDPFTWASGYRMPIYNDNRLLLGNYSYRKLVGQGFVSVIQENKMHYEMIAGTSTAGIPPATTLADLLRTPLIYVRDKPKDHGMRNRIEGIDGENGLKGEQVILIEDLVSTGGSSANAVQGIRDAGGYISDCLSIFSYGFDEAQAMFDGNVPFEDSTTKRLKYLDPKCNLHPLVTYEILIDAAKERGYVDTLAMKILDAWRADPFTWGERSGFPRKK